jgi:hypothetical protein
MAISGGARPEVALQSFNVTGRSTWCIYWCMKEWPEFSRHRELGWMSLGFMRTSVADQIKGGFAEVFRQLLRVFFCSDTFTFGMGCRFPLGDRRFLVQGYSW